MSHIIIPDTPFVKGPRLKFFPPLATFDPPYPLAPDGYLPNSILLRELRKSLADQALAQEWKPPNISTKQRKLLKEMEEEEVCSNVFLRFIVLTFEPTSPRMMRQNRRVTMTSCWHDYTQR